MLVRLALVCLLSAAHLPMLNVDHASASGVEHLVISEIVTGGASASDELIELYNPSSAALPLEGLELVYVTASGHKYHREACRYHQGEHPLPLSKAAADYQPCEVCCPTP